MNLYEKVHADVPEYKNQFLHAHGLSEPLCHIYSPINLGITRLNDTCDLLISESRINHRPHVSGCTVRHPLTTLRDKHNPLKTGQDLCLYLQMGVPSSLKRGLRSAPLSRCSERASARATSA